MLIYIPKRSLIFFFCGRGIIVFSFGKRAQDPTTLFHSHCSSYFALYHRRGKNPVSYSTLSVRGNTIRAWLLPDSLNLDALLVEDKVKATTASQAAKAGPAGGAMGRGRGRGRMGGGMGRGRGRR